ncbi:hypothetical protein CGRA01v4_11874 [Colletotrichum graminicola]|nr:hypothetical protein CGRA01v4_11874 [Colletotrichum graminicola]
MHMPEATSLSQSRIPSVFFVFFQVARASAPPGLPPKGTRKTKYNVSRGILIVAAHPRIAGRGRVYIASIVSPVTRAWEGGQGRIWAVCQTRHGSLVQ